MKYLGAHVSAAGGVQNAPLNAKAIGARAFALFTKNQRQWQARPLDEATICTFKVNLDQAGIQPQHVLPHDSYLIHLSHPDKTVPNRNLAPGSIAMHHWKKASWDWRFSISS